MQLNPWTCLLSVLAGYLAGGVPFAAVVARAKGVDITRTGSGNIGATNVGRVLGAFWGRLVLALDILKGLLPTIFFMLHWPPDEGLRLGILAGAGAIGGHVASPYLLFRGGKGVAVTIGVFAALLREWLLLPLAVWFLVARLTRYVSVASMALALCLPLAGWLRWRGEAGARWVLVFSLLVAVVVIFRHRSNIRRLLAGCEHRVGDTIDTSGAPEKPDG